MSTATFQRTQVGILDRKSCAFPQCTNPASYEWSDGDDTIAVCVQHDLVVRTAEGV